MSIEWVIPSSHLILCRLCLVPPPIPPSIRVFPNGSTLSMRWPKYWSFSFSISPSNEHPGLIAFRIDWLDLLAVQGTLKSLLQHHSSKASIFRRSAFFTVQLSHPYMLLDSECIFALSNSRKGGQTENKSHLALTVFIDPRGVLVTCVSLFLPGFMIESYFTVWSLTLFHQILQISFHNNR